VEIGGKYGFIDKTGKIVITPQFDGAEAIYKGLAKVEVGFSDWDKVGYIDKTGRYVWEPRK
jgi:hypothetical protein